MVCNLLLFVLLEQALHLHYQRPTFDGIPCFEVQLCYGSKYKKLLILQYLLASCS